MSEVVKCKDCYCFYHDDSWNSKSGYCQWFCTPTGINDFCSHGETPRHADIGGELPKPENVVEVVRCKDCIHYWKNSPSDDVPVCLASPKDDAFCSEGKRKEDVDN